MRQATLALTTFGLVLAVIFIGYSTQPASSAHNHGDGSCLLMRTSGARPDVAVCFAEGTSEEYMAEWTHRIQQRAALDYNTGNRWTRTATDGNISGQGQGVNLTYSYVPDGVFVDGASSVLFSRMNELFASQDLWQTQLDSVFQRWQQLTGNTYVHVSDDGASWGGSSPGVLGSRGDVRIGMIDIDGPSGVLAYNQFPNNGDMVFDASETWGTTSQNYVFLRNVAMHEHGHGLGIYHVCPINSTKLMEPTYSSAFYGPQHDDIRAGQRLYGDTYEPNDLSGDPTELGLVTNGFVLSNVSLDDDSDADYYSIVAPGGLAMTLDLVPIGYEYLDGQQNGDGSCQPGSMINSIDDNDLDLYLLNFAGTNVLAQSTTNPPGVAERIERFIIPAGFPTYMIEVSGALSNEIQLYELRFEFVDPATPWLTGCPLEFGNVNVGETADLTATITNPAEGALLTISDISATGPFTVGQATPVTISAGGTLDLTVTFDAAESGEAEGTLTVTHDAPGAALTCELSGKAVAVELGVLPGLDFDFGEAELHEDDSVRVVLRASGNTDLRIESVTTSGAPFFADVEPFTMAPGPIYSIYPHFQPEDLGVFHGTMTITHSGTNSPTVVNLTGSAVNTELESEQLAPREFALAQNYPNPFNPETTIRFSLAAVSPVRLTVFDITGREVATLVNETLSAGAHELDFAANNLPAGVYLYRLTAGSFTDTKKMILLK